MSGEAKYIQPGHHALTPVLYGGLELIEFVKTVFGARELQAGTPDAAGNLHAELEIGDSKLLIGKGYWTDASMKAAIWIYVSDSDATYQRALAAGAISSREPADQTWGDRVCGVIDPSGNTWWIATHKAPR
ncbi:MAG TPA: VOC family protein [Candidatus Binataceae bacterium]|nr:VOC family protein [Candidatus Binataceae bacterium]HVA80364.1 VOC family protein [Candidatus Binataceae bacterium]